MFEIHPLRCTECQICMQICAWEHYGQNNPKRSRIWVEADWPKEPTISVCLACQERECIRSCPTDALQWDGWVRLNEDLCDSCSICVEACPVMGLRMDPHSQTPLVCDTCDGAFQCIQWCPTSAIEKMGI